jgi:hypothetical protein
MCLGENKRFSTFGPGNSEERASASSPLFTSIHGLSICIEAMGGESCLFFVNASVIVFVHCWVYDINSLLYRDV